MWAVVKMAIIVGERLQYKLVRPYSHVLIVEPQIFYALV